MNKITKLLSIFLIAGVAGAGAAGIAGCHSHTFSDEWSSDATNHWHAATCDHKDEKKDEAAHVDTATKDGKCDVCGYTLTTADTGDDNTDSGEVTIPEGATGLKLTLPKTEVTLSEESPSYTLNKSDITFKFANAQQQELEGTVGDTVNVVMKLGEDKYDFGTALNKKGTYQIQAILTVGEKRLAGTAQLTIKDPVRPGSLALKSGTTTQEQGEDVISSTLAWEVTLASGAKEDVPNIADVEEGEEGVIVTGIDTYGVGENKKANAMFKMDDIELTKEFTYTVNDKTGYAVQSYIVNVNKLKTSDKVTANTVLKLADGTTDSGVAVTATSSKYIKIDTSSRDIDGKAFTQRLNMQGSVFDSAGNINANIISRTLKFADLNAPVDGSTSVKTKITLYASSSSAGSARRVSLYKEGEQAAPTQADPDAKVPTLTEVEGAEKEVDAIEKFEWVVEGEGTYHILSKSSGWNVHYIRVDKIIEGGTAAEAPIAAAAGETLASLEKEVPSEVQTYTKGDPFSTEGITVMGVYANDATCDVVKKDVTASADLKYTGYDMNTVGKQTVTIAIGDIKTTYTITVETPVPGIYGVEAKLKDGFVTQIPAASSDTTITIKKSDIVAKAVGENENATVSYTVKKGETEIDDTTGLALEKGQKHTLTVEITVSDPDEHTYTETKTVEVKITKEGELTDLEYAFTAADVTAVGTQSGCTEAVKINDNITVGKGNKAKTENLEIDDVVKYEHRIQIGGAISTTDLATKTIEIKADAAGTLIVAAKASAGRHLVLYKADGTKVGESEDIVNGAVDITFTLDAGGTYYLGSTSSSINVWYIGIDYPAPAAE